MKIKVHPFALFGFGIVAFAGWNSWVSIACMWHLTSNELTGELIFETEAAIIGAVLVMLSGEEEL